MDNEAQKPQVKPLTPHQRSVCQAYFAAGFRTGRAATNLGCSRQHILQVRSLPAAREYLHSLEAATVDVLVQVRAAQIIAPLLGISTP